MSLERVLRGAALALVLVLAWSLFAPPGARGRLDADTADLRQLARWTGEPPADTVHLAVGAVPGPTARAWLAALAGAGTAVTWSGAPPAAAAEVVALADPAGAVRVLAAGPAGGLVRVGDALGPLDSARSAGGGVMLAMSGPRGPVSVEVAGQGALAAVPQVARRRAVVLGAAGWESRFVTLALEERGWQVDARFRLAPGLAVSQGTGLPLDTAAHAVVVVLDSLGDADAAAVARFARAGGGVVLGAAANVTRGPLAPLAPGVFGERVRRATLSFAADAPARSLALRPVLPRADALPLERAPGGVAVAARREGAGRVVQAGYEDTWRWRMEGGPDGPAAHRGWWGDVAAAAAYRAEGAVAAVHDPAPLAALTAALGPPRAPPPPSRAPLDPGTFVGPLVAALLACLLAEWASRRMRGAV